MHEDFSRVGRLVLLCIGRATSARHGTELLGDIEGLRAVNRPLRDRFGAEREILDERVSEQGTGFHYLRVARHERGNAPLAIRLFVTGGQHEPIIRRERNGGYLLRLIREIDETLLAKRRGSTKQPGEFRRSQNDTVRHPPR